MRWWSCDGIFIFHETDSRHEHVGDAGIDPLALSGAERLLRVEEFPTCRFPEVIDIDRMATVWECLRFYETIKLFRNFGSEMMISVVGVSVPILRPPKNHTPPFHVSCPEKIAWWNRG